MSGAHILRAYSSDACAAEVLSASERNCSNDTYRGSNLAMSRNFGMSLGTKASKVCVCVVVIAVRRALNALS